jgi:hypothetical protein
MIFFLVQEILQEIHDTAGGRQEDLSGQENQQEPDLLYTSLRSRDGSHKDNFGESLEKSIGLAYGFFCQQKGERGVETFF